MWDNRSNICSIDDVLLTYESYFLQSRTKFENENPKFQYETIRVTSLAKDRNVTNIINVLPFPIDEIFTHFNDRISQWEQNIMNELLTHTLILEYTSFNCNIEPLNHFRQILHC